MSRPSHGPDLVVPLDGRPGLTVDLVGGKGHGLNRIRALGLPTPPAFVLTTDAFGDHSGHAPAPIAEPLWVAVVDHLATIEQTTGRTFGSSTSPLLVSVRSGAAVSMPGMMDTVLNLGVPTGFGQGLDHESARWAAHTRAGFEASWADAVGGSPPSDPHQQLQTAIAAVRSSWWSDRARVYRDRYDIDQNAGTAVVVQAMVFGNRDDRSGTGVAFSRDPATGEPGLTGEWIARGQGDELVSGRRTPQPMASLAAAEPEVAAALAEAVAVLEADLRDVVEVELTVETGRLHLLQRRTAKRSARAAVRSSVDLCREGLIDRATAVARIPSHQADALAAERGTLDGGTELARGLPASPGTAAGTAVGDIDQALDLAEDGHPVVLVRPATSPHDVVAMLQSVAVVTERGGSSSHAALVCREAGLPAVVGCGPGTIDRLVGRPVTVDGTTGRVLDGDRTGVTAGEDGAAVRTLVAWAVEGLDTDRLPADHPLASLAGCFTAS
jgi:pyruvate,orthophosphate dikinase